MFTYLHVIKCLLHFIINCSLLSVALVGGFFCSARSESHFQPQPSGAHAQLSCCSRLFSALPITGRSGSRLIGYSGLLAFFPGRKDHPPFPLTHLLSFPYGRRREKNFQSHHMSLCQQFNCSPSNHRFYCWLSDTHCLPKELRVTQYPGSCQERCSKKANISSRANYF